jgi:diguanylate cyclase (GGDEF)-like protein
MQRIAILYDASQAVLSTFDLDEVLNQVLAIVRDYFHLQSGSIMLLDEVSQRLVVHAHFGIADAEHVTVPFGKGITGIAAKARRPIYSPDVTTDPRYIPRIPNTRSELAIPLMVRNEVVGVLDCHSDQPSFFDNETVDLLTLFATQASIGLQNAKLYSMLQRRAAQLEAINAIAKRTTVELDLKELLDRLCTQLPQSFRVEHVAIFLRDEEGELILRAQQGTLAGALNVGDRLPQGYACTTGGGRRTPYAGDPSLCPAACFPAGREEVCLPLVSFGENIGLLVCATTQSDAFLTNDIQALESVADILATATQNARYVARVRQLAYRDGLTGVFNRRYFDSRLVDEVTRAARYGGGVSVLMIDLDHFKKVNDECGHMVGDDVLRTVSASFVRQLRKVDVVCRYGGEEFAVVLPATQGASAAAVAEKLRRAVSNTEFPGVSHPVTVSIGVAEFPVHGITRDDIVRAADAALYNAKEAGRNQVRLASVTAAGDSSNSPGV